MAVQDIEVRFFDRLTNARLAFNPDDVTGVDWETLESGGVGQITIKLAKRFDDLTFAPIAGCLVEVIVWSDPLAVMGGLEPAPRARGILSLPEASLDLAESRTLTAYGLAEDMGHVRFDGQFIEPGGADVSVFASRVLDAYLQQRPWLRGRISSSINATGIVRESVESSGTCRDALKLLENQGPGLIVWGWRVNSTDGSDEFVFQAKQGTIAHQFFVGDNVKRLSRPEDLAKVINAAKFIGGQSDTPNLLGAVVDNNTGFERADIAGATDHLPGSPIGNLLKDGGMESRYTHWGTSGGAAFKSSSLSEGPARSGSNMAELDNSGETIYQLRSDSADALIAGRTIVFSTWCRREHQTDTRTATMWVEFFGSGGSLGTSASVPLTPTSAGYWQEVRGSIVVPAGVTSWRFNVQAGGGTGGILIDDASVFYLGQLKPRGWETYTYGTASFQVVDPLYTSEFWGGGKYGRSCLRIACTSADTDGQDCGIRPAKNAKFAVSGGQTLLIALRARRTPGSTATPSKLWIEVKDSRSTETHASFPTGAIIDTWRLFWYSWTAPGNVDSAELHIVFRGSTDILLDAIQVRDASSGTPLTVSGSAATDYTDADPARLEYITSANWERYIKASEVCTAGSPGALSEGLLDLREATISNDTLRRWDAATQGWIKAYFDSTAPLPDLPRLEVAAEWDRIIDPLAGAKIRISELAIDLADEYPARARYTWAPSSQLALSIELGLRRPDLALSMNAAIISSGGLLFFGPGSANGGGGSVAAGGYPSAGAGTGGTSLSLPLSIAQGGTASTSAGAARTALGITPANIGAAASSHTHTASEVTDFAEAVDDRVGSLLVAGSNVTLTYNDAGNALTIAATTGGSSSYQMALTLLADKDVLSLTSLSTGRSELAGATHRRAWLDLSDMNTTRISAVIASPSGVTGTLFVEYSTDSGSTWHPLVTSDGACVSVASAGTKRSGWNSLVSGAKADVMLRPELRIDSSSSGSFALGLLVIEFRTASGVTSTADDGALEAGS